MKYKFVFLCLCFVALLACTDRSRNVADNVALIDVPIHRNDFSGLFDSIFELDHYVVLESVDESLIRKVGKIVFYKEHIYILDTDEWKVLAFDKSGNYLRQYSHLGQGPGEYLSLTDFVIEHDVLYLLDRNGGQLLLYNLEDSLLQTQKNDKARGLCVLGHDRYAFNLELGSADKDPDKYYCSYAYWNNKENVFRDKSYNKELCGLSYSLSEGANSFYHYNDSIFTFFPYNDTIYSIDKQNGKLSSYLAVRIGDEHILLGDDKKRIDELRKKVSSTIFAFYKWEDMLMFSYYYNGENRKYVIVDQNKNIIFTGAFGLDKNKVPVRVVAYDSDKEEAELLSVTYPFEVLGLAKHHGKDSDVLKKMAADITEEGNPILVLYKIRNNSKVR